jgi:hypothetical protein
LRGGGECDSRFSSCLIIFDCWWALSVTALRENNQERFTVYARHQLKLQGHAYGDNAVSSKNIISVDERLESRERIIRLDLGVW